MFTQKAFIKKINDKLINELIKIGYKPIPECPMGILEKRLLKIDKGHFYEGFYNSPDAINCGENDELFLAIASMTDIELSNIDYYIVIEDGNLWHPKGCIKKGLPMDYTIHPSYYRKATVEELIEYFK